MSLWAAVLEIVRAGLFATTHLVGGSVGGGIFVLAALVRVAMIPITFGNAKRRYGQGVAMARLKPQVDALRSRYAADPLKLNEATMRLYADNGIKMTAGMGQAILQAPIGIAMWTTIKNNAGASTPFLWIRSLAKPDVMLALVAAGVTGLLVRFSSADQQQQQRLSMLVAMGITFFFTWKMSAGVALYSIAWGGVSNAEMAVVRLRARKAS